MSKAINPIMSGFYPDPTICAVGEDYYLVNSSFAYFPGLPIMHSKDLAHWEQIGNILDRESQLPLLKAGHSRGLFAPTLRYNNGTFYCICTNVDHGGNFIVTATSPEGPWSDPYYLEGADGIDPSLFFDDDGKCYYIGTHENPEGAKYNGDWYIWIQEVDIENMKLVGPKKDVWNGALKNCIWPEGPHIYKENGYYYIMHAEGGTGPEHAVMVCRSKDIWGPYVGNPKNPILTHRHLGADYPIKYVGHCDIIQTPKGEWYMTMLAVRPLERFTTMGRETFLAKFIWEEDWPVVNPGVGMLTETVDIDLPDWDPKADSSSYTSRTKGNTCEPGSNRTYDFTSKEKLGDEFLFLRNPDFSMYSLDNNGLSLKCLPATIKEEESPAFIAIRQQHHSFEAAAKVDVSGVSVGNEAGLVLIQNNLYNFKVVADSAKALAVITKDGEDTVLGEVAVCGEVNLSIKVQGLKASAIVDGKVIGEADVRTLSTEVAGGFVGCCVGAYASANGKASDDKAVFKSLSYNA